ncbi:uncharacterized protein [Cicer arietinum]|uniref:uncharacterized protein n=1 Tax=Cicer arietinum TaxID=3827 RepID=UPI003CC61766
MVKVEGTAERYGGKKSDNPSKEMKYLQQTGDVEKYISNFEYFSSQVMHLPDEQYLGYFLGGLQLEVRLRVGTFNPKTHVEAMKLARDVEIELRGVLNQRGSECGVLFRIAKEGRARNCFPYALRLEGTVKGIQVTMMVDTGATHNFVSPQIVADLQLPIEQIPITNEKFGNGFRVAITEKCGKFDIQIGRFQTTGEAYIVELQGEDKILGVAWMYKLDKVLFDCLEDTAHFEANGNDRTLRIKRNEAPKSGAHSTKLQTSHTFSF